jgi:hypothetical protein
MKEFEFDDASVEVLGHAIDDFLSTLGPYKARGEAIACRELGVDELKTGPGVYYSMNGYLSLLREIQEQFGQEFVRRLGRETTAHAKLPPHVTSAEAIFSSMTEVLYASFKNAEGKLGSYEWTATTTGGQLVCDTPYPCALGHGALEGLARRFHPDATVEHLDDQSCRHAGGDSCTYRVTWKPVSNQRGE